MLDAQVKPADRRKHSFLYKLATSPADSAVRLTTNKLPLVPGTDLLRIQLNLEYNWASRSREIFWRRVPGRTRGCPAICQGSSRAVCAESPPSGAQGRPLAGKRRWRIPGQRGPVCLLPANSAHLSRVQYRLNDRVQLWPHWHMSLHVPEVEGCALMPALCGCASAAGLPACRRRGAPACS